MKSCIQVKNISKKFGSKMVLQDITFEINTAEIFCLLGPSGSGKTTLIKCIAGIDQATKGSIFVLGQEMPELNQFYKIGYMAQSDALYKELTAKENLEFFSSLYGLRGQDQKKRIMEVMEIVDLVDDLDVLVKNYSGGMKRRLSLAIALIHQPPILILDEPTVGIDPILRKEVWKELYRLAREGKSILVTTHVMDEAERCNRIGMIYRGRLLGVDTPQKLKEEANVETIEEAFLQLGRGK